MRGRWRCWGMHEDYEYHRIWWILPCIVNIVPRIAGRLFFFILFSFLFFISSNSIQFDWNWLRARVAFSQPKFDIYISQSPNYFFLPFNPRAKFKEINGRYISTNLRLVEKKIKRRNKYLWMRVGFWLWPLGPIDYHKAEPVLNLPFLKQTNFFTHIRSHQSDDVWMLTDTLLKTHQHSVSSH